MNFYLVGDDSEFLPGMMHDSVAPRRDAVQLQIGAVSGFAALVAAEAGWRALFATVDGTETGRSRIIAWASVERDGATEMVRTIRRSERAEVPRRCGYGHR